MIVITKEPENLSPNQKAVRDAVIKSQHHLCDIAERSGYCITTIRNWTQGLHEPMPNGFRDVMQALKELESVSTNHRNNWKPKLAELKACRDKGLPLHETARKMGASYRATAGAIHMYLRDAS
jgi:hypothetical protein